MPRKRRNTSHHTTMDIAQIVSEDRQFKDQVLKSINKHLGKQLALGKITDHELHEPYLRIANLADKFYSSSRRDQKTGAWRKRKGFSLTKDERYNLAGDLVILQNDSIMLQKIYWQDGDYGGGFYNNPSNKRRKNGMAIKKNSAKQRKAQSNAAKAMKLYQSGEASSLKEAWRMVKSGKANPRKRKNTAKRKNFHHNPRNVKLDIKLPNTNLRVVGAGMDANGNSVVRFAIGSNRAFSIQTVGTRMHPVKSDLVHIKKIFAKDLKAFTNAAIKHIKSFGTASQKKSLKVYKNNPRKRRNSAHSDDIAIREILLTVTNDGDFYRQVLQPNLKNLGRHMYRGNFTRAGAMKSFQRIANLADKFYQFNYGTRTRGVRYFGQQRGFMLSASDRKILAAEMLEDQMEAIQYFADEMQAGVKYKDLNNNPHCMPNPRRRKNSRRRKSNPRRRRNSSAQAKAQSNAKKAMDLYHSGKAKSLKSAWRMVKRG